MTVNDRRARPCRRGTIAVGLAAFAALPAALALCLAPFAGWRPVVAAAIIWAALAVAVAAAWAARPRGGAAKRSR